jgi:hypothetical protein
MQMSESKMSWIGIIFTSIGLITTVYYHDHILKATRMESEMKSYLLLNQRYHELLFTLIHNDSEVFQKVDDQSLKENKYIIYELLNLISTVKTMESCFNEVAPEIKADWERKTNFLLTKPAVQFAWEKRIRYADKIFNPNFISFVENVIEHNKSLSDIDRSSQ